MKHQIINELKILGYVPKIEKYEKYYDITFATYGFDDFKNDHKDIIKKICGAALMEFYYGWSIQHIYIKDERTMRKLKLEKINKIK